MTTSQLPANVTAVRNTDRYTRCASCRAEAEFRFSSTTATITTIRPGMEPTSEWVDGAQVFVDDVRVVAAQVTACRRHVEINVRRVAEATSRTVVITFDENNRPTRTEVAS